MNTWLDRRRAGVLLHITSLSGPQPCGTLGVEARNFINDMVRGGFSVWQFLPLGPTHGHGSPYESLSTFAGNPNLIDLRELATEDWANAQISTLEEAASCFWEASKKDAKLSADVVAFTRQNSAWLDDFSLFSALKKSSGGKAWWQWGDALRNRDAQALKAARKASQQALQQVIFEQFIFARQIQALKTYAESKDVVLFGDLPIYVAHDSADVWANQHLFTVNEDGLCDEVAGVPPDYFCESGQRWGNPLYRWDALAASGFDWWIKRVEAQLERMHLLRIDHFRGLEAYWSIPGNRDDGKIGEWIEAPGEALLTALKNALGKLPIAAEDLGLITPQVTALLDAFDLPGMKVLQFAFDGSVKNPYLPGNFTPNSVVYTGTHDNDTSMGWFSEQSEQSLAQLAEYTDLSGDNMPWPLIRMAIESDARLAIIPMQDLLELGSHARFNTPGTLDDNWHWRMQEHVAADAMWAHAHELNLRSCRIIESNASATT
ncbi:MAG: 4-alpha-glucanotransferase [Mariprofundaceae bacterium]